MSIADQARALAVELARGVPVRALGSDSVELQHAEAEAFENDGYSGSVFHRVRTIWRCSDHEYTVNVISKKWSEQSWVTQLLGSGRAAEQTLHTAGLADVVASETGLDLPRRRQ